MTVGGKEFHLGTILAKNRTVRAGFIEYVRVCCWLLLCADFGQVQEEMVY